MIAATPSIEPQSVGVSINVREQQSNLAAPGREGSFVPAVAICGRRRGAGRGRRKRAVAGESVTVPCEYVSAWTRGLAAHHQLPDGHPPWMLSIERVSGWTETSYRVLRGCSKETTECFKS
jgi:hypothetical protein